MSIVLTGRCERRRHVMSTVNETDGGYVLEGVLMSIGREKEHWTPGSRLLDPARMQRFGCACGRTALLSDRQMLENIRRGETEWVISGSSISAKRRSATGK